jgi:hypothetical protein
VNDRNPTTGGQLGEPTDELSLVRRLLAESPPPEPGVVATARATLNQAIQHAATKPGATRHQHGLVPGGRRAHRLAAVAAAALLLAGGTAYGLTAGLGNSAAPAPHHTMTTGLTTVSGCVSVKIAMGTLEQIHGTTLVLRTLNGQRQIVTTSSRTKVTMFRAPLSSIADGERASVFGTRSPGKVAAQGVITGLAGHSTFRVSPASLTAFTGTVTQATRGGFVLVTSTGTHVPVTTSSRTNVMVFRASLSRLQIGAGVLAVGHPGPAGTLAAFSVLSVPHLPNPAHFQFIQPHGCSPSAITTSVYLAAGAAAPALP